MLVFAPLYPLAHFYDRQIQKDTAEKGIWVLSLKNKTFDYVLVGSSRVFNVVSPLVMDSVLGMKGVNLGVGGTGYAENFLLLDQFFKNGNKAKIILIQVDMWGLLAPEKAYSHPFNDQCYLFLIGKGTSDSVIAKNTNPLKHVLRKYLPFFSYAEYNNIYPMNSVYAGFPHKPADFEKEAGVYLRDNDGQRDKVFTDSLKVQHREYCAASAESLQQLIALARKHNCTVVFFTSPTYSVYLPYEPDNKVMHDSLDAIANRNSIPYFDFEKSSICDERKDFRDFTHLNRKGSGIFSALLADSLLDWMTQR